MVWRHLAQGAKEWVGKGADTVARGERTAPRLPRPAGGTPSPPPLNPFPSLPAVRDPHPPPERLLYAFATPGRTEGSTAFPWGLPLACLATFVAVALNIAAMCRRPEARVIGLALGSAVAGLLLMWAAAAR